LLRLDLDLVAGASAGHSERQDGAYNSSYQRERTTPMKKKKAIMHYQPAGVVSMEQAQQPAAVAEHS
jgi:hypothetical protein